MGTRSFIIIEHQDHFQGVYCHWDGYLEGNGLTLLTHYTSPEQVEALIDGGNMSSLGDTPEDCAYYKGPDEEPLRRSRLSTMMRVAEACGCEFVYVFNAGKQCCHFAEQCLQYFGLSDRIPFFDFKPLNSEAITQSVNR